MLSGDQQATLDIRRSIILGSYIRHWGAPQKRSVFTIFDQLFSVEIYAFSCEGNFDICRFATFGMSSQKFNGKFDYFNYELLFVFSYDFCGSSYEGVLDYIRDMILHCVENGTQLKSGSTFGVSPRAPAQWKQKALLVDEPRGEAEELDVFPIGERLVSLLWVIPIYESEADFIKKHGIERFDDIVNKKEVGITDMDRERFV